MIHFLSLKTRSISHTNIREKKHHPSIQKSFNTTYIQGYQSGFYKGLESFKGN